MPLILFFPSRFPLLADFHPQGATRVESATRRGGRRRRYLSGQDGACRLAEEIHAGNGGQKGARIGMKRIFTDLFRASELGDSTEIHDGNPVAHMPHDRKVVRDE